MPGFPSSIPQGKEESKPLQPALCAQESSPRGPKLALGKGDGSQEGENGKFPGDAQHGWVTWLVTYGGKSGTATYL